jgi:sugar (pentulose or hexulose) kinase
MMSKSDLVIGLDCSTTGPKAIGFDRREKVLGHTHKHKSRSSDRDLCSLANGGTISCK